MAPFWIILFISQTHLNNQDFFPEEEILVVPRLTHSKGFESTLLSYHFSLGIQTERYISDSKLCYISNSSYPSPKCHHSDRTKSTTTLFYKRAQRSDLYMTSRHGNCTTVQRYWQYESYWEEKPCKVDLSLEKRKCQGREEM